MSLSRKSSFDTVVFEKPETSQALGNPEHFKKDLDLRGLSKYALKSFEALAHWRQSQQCSNVSIVQATVNRISGYSEQYNAAIKTTFTAAEKGSIFCDTLVKEPTTQHALAETITKLITVADKGYGRSVQAHGQLLSIHAGLVQISDGIPSQVSKIQENLEKQGQDWDDYGFRGEHTNIAMWLKSGVYTPPSGIGGYRGYGPDSDDEDEQITDMVPPMLSSWDSSVYKYVTFKSAASQMKEIAADVATVIEIVGRCVDWWAKIKMASENLQASVLKEGLRLQSLLPEDHVDGWKTLGDKFALYIYKTSPSIVSYYPSPMPLQVPMQPWDRNCGFGTPYVPPTRVRRSRSRSRSRSSSRSHSPVPWPASQGPPIVIQGPSRPYSPEQPEKTKSLWKRLSCIS